MEIVEIVGKNEKGMTLANDKNLSKVYELIMKEEDFIIKHPDYSEVFTSSNFSAKLKTGDYKLNASSKKED
jgi:cell division protein YceG involved in septum cleavage